MNSARSDPPPDAADAGEGHDDRADGPRVALKILVAGGFGVGKTTMVGAVSEIRPLRTEEALTDASIGVDDLDGVAAKTTTTVAMDFGRITLSAHHMMLLLFGTPGQKRFWFMWDHLASGAIGAVVLADTRRLADCFAAVEYFERRGLPFVVGVNEFDDAYHYTPDEVKAALHLRSDTPVMCCDARATSSARSLLIRLVEHAHARSLAARAEIPAEPKPEPEAGATSASESAQPVPTSPPRSSS